MTDRDRQPDAPPPEQAKDLHAEIKTFEARIGLGNIAEHEKLDQYRHILEAAIEGIWVIDAGHITTFANDKLQAMLRCARDQLVGRSILDFVLDEDREGFLVHLASRRDGRSEIYEHRYRRADGSTVWMQVSASPIFNDRGEFQGSFAMLTDITDRLKAQQELQESEQRFRALYENMAEGVALHRMIYDNAGKPVNYLLLDVNPQYEQLVGVRRQDIVGKLATDAYHVPTPPYLEEFASTVLTGRPYRFETYSAPMDKHFSISVTAAGPDQFATIFWDITEQKRTLAKVLQQQSMLEAIIENIPFDFWARDRDNRLLLQNKANQEHYHETPGQPFGQAAISPEVLRRWEDNNRRALDGEVVRQDEVYHDPAGIRHVHATIAPIRQGDQIIGTLGVNLDITDRKLAEQALRESENRYRTLFEGVAEGILIADGQTQQFRYANPAICAMLGYEADELTRLAVKDVHPADTLRKAQESFESQVRTGAANTIFTLPMLRKDGSTFIADLRSFQATIDGKPCLVGFITDITERLAVEDERRRLEAQVLQAQKLESLGVLAGGIAHDFNNLLVAIMGNADLALLDMPPNSPGRASVESIRQAAQRASELTNQMLAYSGKGRFVIETISLNDLVRDMADLLRVSVSRKIALSLDFAQDLPSVEVDVSQIRQIVMNLVINASEAIGDHSGVITLRTNTAPGGRTLYAGAAFAQDLPEDLYVRLQVIDTGCGMTDEVRAKLFDPFFTTKFAGRGLGLAAVLGIVRGHKGAIRVESAPGKGTAFSIYLPARPAATATPPPATVQPQWTGSGTVLVVDDEEGVRRIAKAMLERQGFEVTLAEDGAQAIEMFRKTPARFHAVLLDMTMPNLSGEETFSRLRQIDPDVRVILTSGFSELDAMGRFHEGAPTAFLQKPFTFEALADKVRQALTSQPPP